MERGTSDTEHFVFLLLGEFSLLALANAVEPFRIANLVSDQTLYRWSYASGSGDPVRSSSGTEISVEHSLSDVQKVSRLFLLSGSNVADYITPRIISNLRRLSRHGQALGTLCSGGYALAASGLLDGQSVAVHWEFHDALQEQFPNVTLCPGVFVADAPVISASGGTANADLMLHLISQRHGDTLATKVADQMVYNAVRGEAAPQRVSLQSKIGSRSRKLAEAIDIIRQQIEDTLSPTDVADEIGISTRQLERLFKQHLSTSPKRYMLDQKLDRARHLLVQTEMSVTDIAMACGFPSASTFSRTYRYRFGIKPGHQKRALT